MLTDMAWIGIYPFPSEGADVVATPCNQIQGICMTQATGNFSWGRVQLWRSVWRTVLVMEIPFSLEKRCLEIVVWVSSLIAQRSISDFEIDNFIGSFVK